ncbi:sensor histidine kinase [Sphingobacterium sp. SG20118]|uniref:sensor histidine kinase n=1 Tax=unclassified Sphingobacterium TaxID=2609468 RepID=UPI0004F81615|nr:HAMP domain-containing sensor histidine kinase [Sphingobacterium sp. ML3W]AIM36411.1 histidine kinase [Sphingobacterium sp. ML3W]
MNLKNRLSVYAAFIFGVIILIASTIIYVSFYTKMESQEFRNLENKTLLSALFYLEKDEVSFIEHESIKNQLQKNISKSNILVVDSLNRRYDGLMEDEAPMSSDFFDLVRKQNIAQLKTDSFFYNGLFYHDNEGDFVIVTRASTAEFHDQMQLLLHILLAVSLIGLILILIFSQFLGNIAYDPILKMISEIKKRDNQNFNEPIVLNKSYQEVQELVDTYNHFVEKLSQTFSIQKNFIDYVSHELRTPLAAILGTLEVSKQKPRTVAEHELISLQLKRYTEDLRDTIDHMMILSGAKTNFETKKIRIDEVLWEIIEQVTLVHHAQINVDIQVADTDLLKVEANDKLLQLAIQNIVLNAVKYSDNQPVEIRLKSQGGKLLVEIVDQGIGILPAELIRVTDNFYRGENAQEYNGKGIGLSLANVIFTLHHIHMHIRSGSQGTIVSLQF